MKIKIPYGDSFIESGSISDYEEILPKESKRTKQEEKECIKRSFESIKEEICYSKLIKNAESVAIAINDLTRPIPNDLMLIPLLQFIESHGIKSKNIALYVSTGTHKNLSPNELQILLTKEVSDKYRTVVHDCDETDELISLGTSSRGTPISINRSFYDSDYKIVVGHIEPHHFMGYSGGVKSAVIGLGGRETIEKNHNMIKKEKAKMGIFYDNPMRQDIEEIGKMIGIDLAFNVILNSNKQIIHALLGNPYDVMEKGIELSRESCQAEKEAFFDLVIASPGGYPKDINLYQSQKAITHACSFLKRDGVVILVAECREGHGSDAFISYYFEKQSYQEVIETFENEKFTVGPHKAYQLALQIKDHPIIVVSDLDSELLRNMFLIPANSLNEALTIAQEYFHESPRIAFLPYATHIIPK